MGVIDDIVSGLSVTQDTAKQDLIQLNIHRWSFQGTSAQFASFSARLSGTFDLDNVPRKVFLGQQHTDERPIWPVVGGIGGVRYVTKPGRPLFSGRLRGYQSTSRFGDSELRNWMLTAELSLNPTRAMVYEKRLGDLPRAAGDAKLGIPATLFAGKHPHWNGVIPLVHGDNVAMGSQRLLSLFAPVNWPVNVRRYWSGILALLDDLLEEAASHAGGFIQYPTQRLTLQSIETYWEFADPNPIATVAALERPFRSAGARSSVGWSQINDDARRLFRSSGIEIGNDDNSPIIKVFPAKHTMLKAYAKATDRIRLEVRHTKGSPALGRYTSNNTTGLLDWISSAAEDSAKTLNAILATLRTISTEITGWQHLPQRFIFDVCSALQDQGTALHLVELLIRNGKLEKSPQGSLAQPIQRLLEAQIIQFIGSSGEVRIYHVAERYRKALRVLQAAAAEPL